MSEPITELLHRWRDGDADAERRLVELTYEELRRVARAQLRGERSDPLLQPTALVHEAYGRMVGLQIDWQDRVHFLSLAARTMRRVLVDEARKRSADKRGGGRGGVTLDSRIVDESGNDHFDLVDLDRALTALGAEHERPFQVIELHYFGGLTHDEVAASLNVSESTVLRDLRFARAWLRARLEE